MNSHTSAASPSPDRETHWRQPRRGCRGHIPQCFGWGTSTGISPPQYYCVLSDIADQYRLPSVRSASSRFHSAIRRHQFASVPSHTSPHSVVRPPNLELALTPLARPLGAHPVPPNLYIFPEFSVCDRDGNDNNMELAALKSS